jgi:hypothetical protein
MRTRVVAGASICHFKFETTNHASLMTVRFEADHQDVKSSAFDESMAE